VVEHDGHTHITYVCELPREPGEVQRTLGIFQQASLIVAVRNPDAPAPQGTGLGARRRPQLPQELMERFGGRRFAPLDPPSFLDHEGVELVLIGAAVDAESELGIHLDARDEDVESADIIRELRLPQRRIPLEPLETGRWT
jgi:hypothetical protein